EDRPRPRPGPLPHHPLDLRLLVRLRADQRGVPYVGIVSGEWLVVSGRTEVSSVRRHSSGFGLLTHYGSRITLAELTTHHSPAHDSHRALAGPDRGAALHPAV